MLKEQLKEVEHRIQAACDRAGRKREEVTLIAVSQTYGSDSKAMDVRQLRSKAQSEHTLQDTTDSLHNGIHIFLLPLLSSH